jgi:hypothetical protein
LRSGAYRAVFLITPERDSAKNGQLCREFFVMSEGVRNLEPIQVRFSKAPAITGDSRVALYEAVRRGQLDLIKDDAGRSYLLYAQLKARCEARKIVKKPTENPTLKAARDARWARHRAGKARQQKPTIRKTKSRKRQ